MNQLGLFTTTWLVRPLAMLVCQRYLPPSAVKAEGYLIDADTSEEAWEQAERRWGPCETVVRAED